MFVRPYTRKRPRVPLDKGVRHGGQARRSGRCVICMLAWQPQGFYSSQLPHRETGVFLSHGYSLTGPNPVRPTFGPALWTSYADSLAGPAGASGQAASRAVPPRRLYNSITCTVVGISGLCACVDAMGQGVRWDSGKAGW